MDFRFIESLERFKNLFDGMSDGIIIYESPNTILWVNHQVTEILSKSKEELLGEDIINILPWLKDIKKNDCYCTLMNNGKSSNPLQATEITLQEGPPQINTILLKEISMSKYEKRLLQKIEIQKDNDESHKSFDKSAKYCFKNIIGKNKQLIDMKMLAQRAATASSPILIYGETGTGKELFVQSIHNQSNRAKKKFVAINCAAIPEHLLESMFFGTVRGAYTGAVDRVGLFEMATEGTLFLDEINSMPLTLQSKLLRVIQEGSVRRVGGKESIRVNPRIISAMNVEPFNAIENNLLRRDLFYRLGVVCIQIPSLRERKDDILVLADYFIKKICGKLNKPYIRLSQDVLDFFNRYDWPGNVRQLEYVIEGILTIIKDGESEILLEHLPEYFRVTYTRTPTTVEANEKMISLQDQVDRIEKNKILSALEETNGNISLAAKKLQISRQSLYYRMKKYIINHSNGLS